MESPPRLSRVSVTLAAGIFFSTDSVDKSVGKLFNWLRNAVMLVFVTNWLKIVQLDIIIKYQLDTDLS